MKKLLSFSIVALFSLGTFGIASANDNKANAKAKTLTGTISDSHCKFDHGMATHGGKMTDAECVNACVKGGAKYVLADKADNKVYEIKNQEKAKAFAGKKVKITGEVSGDSVTVEQIQAMP